MGTSAMGAKGAEPNKTTAKKRWNFTRYSSLLKGFADLVSDITEQEPKKAATYKFTKTRKIQIIKIISEHTYCKSLPNIIHLVK